MTTEFDDDPYLWLEEVESQEALDWVAEHNAKALERLTGDPRYQAIYDDTLKNLTQTDRLPEVRVLGEHVYDLLQDADHARGLWRRTSVEDFVAGQPDWETVLDVDALDAEEKRSWVFRDLNCLAPEYKRCMLNLSPGGSDASEWREFDLEKKAFVENGFMLPEAKTWLAWRDENTLMVTMAEGGNTETSSGYGRQVRLWTRGTPFSEATVIHEVDADHMTVQPRQIIDDGNQYNLLSDAVTIFQSDYYRLGDNNDVSRLHLPEAFQFSTIHKGWVVGLLQSDWKELSQGALVGFRIEDLEEEPEAATTVFEPSESQAVQSLLGMGVMKSDEGVYFSILNDVEGELLRASFDGGEWQTQRVSLPANGTTAVAGVAGASDTVIARYESFTQPPTLFATRGGDTPEQVDRLQERFDGSGYVTEQFFATSADGTKVPYFIVHPIDLEQDGSAPALLGAYGGFGLPITPGYMGTIFGVGAPFKTMVTSGGSYVLANIRGGGEYGPGWHEAGKFKNRQRVYDDFHAVAEDLIARKFTSSSKLGIVGASNSGLLMGVAFTQRPDLYGAVLCGVPLLDMRRYHLLLAGASWMGEYGDPDDPEMWEVIKTYSPYHNLSAEKDYPGVLLFGSTKDDRVHPGHMRKMAARMTEMGHEYLFYENVEGGHGAAADLVQQAQLQSLQAVYLLQELNI
ncbi:MAG: prolyl oligopeptidase family serine peptidase [Pseudomonadales bacterium]|nr:prolyl oligopeptidase family serine peptidase [Kiritimatiellia bacterium]MDP6970026.1 prolyl oligopeptidase family serine peptidase [Pseudomonadales bacterium]